MLYALCDDSLRLSILYFLCASAVKVLGFLLFLETWPPLRLSASLLFLNSWANGSLRYALSALLFAGLRYSAVKKKNKDLSRG